VCIRGYAPLSKKASIGVGDEAAIIFQVYAEVVLSSSPTVEELADE
jgi:hypothetical protein